MRTSGAAACEHVDNFTDPGIAAGCTAVAEYVVYFTGCSRHGGVPFGACEEHAAIARVVGHESNRCTCGNPLTVARISVN